MLKDFLFFIFLDRIFLFLIFLFTVKIFRALDLIQGLKLFKSSNERHVKLNKNVID